MPICSIEIDNIAASKINIDFALTSKDFTNIVENQALTHNKVNYIKTGCFEAKFVKLIFTIGTPISLKKIKIHGRVFDKNLNLNPN